ncbi:MAG: AP2 domain-containing protein [Bacilli bacterium]|nr:AP2 domain-containing protein [Bacilli bacterium]
MSNIKYKPEDYIGKCFGKWTVVGYSLIKKPENSVHCKCECGKELDIPLYRLITGRSRGCRICASPKRTIFNKRLYSIWHDMKTRCYNPKHSSYKNYGERGIIICNEWKNNFTNFYNWAINNGYKEDLTIDRIDVNGNYEPSNCRWATYTQQNINRRMTKLNTSGYSGIRYITTGKRRKRWLARIVINYKEVALGHYKTQKEALEARNKYIIDNGLDYPIQEYKGEIGSINNQ